LSCGWDANDRIDAASIDVATKDARSQDCIIQSYNAINPTMQLGGAARCQQAALANWGCPDINLGNSPDLTAAAHPYRAW
jgi:hypothetical protein